MDEVSITTLVGSAGLAIGIAFGAVTRRTDFCALGAITDIEIYGDFRRLRSWLMAIATAMAGMRYRRYPRKQTFRGWSQNVCL